MSKKVHLFSDVFSGKREEDPDYWDTRHIKDLFKKNNIPYEEFANKSHKGDPQVKVEDKIFSGFEEVAHNLWFIIDYIHPDKRN